MIELGEWFRLAVAGAVRGASSGELAQSLIVVTAAVLVFGVAVVLREAASSIRARAGQAESRRPSPAAEVDVLSDRCAWTGDEPRYSERWAPGDTGDR